MTINTPISLVERAEARGLGDLGGGGGVSADPQLGLGLLAGAGAAEELGEGGPRSPGVVLDGVLQDEGRGAGSHGAPTIRRPREGVENPVAGVP